jgi:hypothetical protein
MNLNLNVQNNNNNSNILLKKIKENLNNQFYYIDQDKFQNYKKKFIANILNEISDEDQIKKVKKLVTEIFKYVKCKSLTSVLSELKVILQNILDNLQEEEIIFLFMEDYLKKNNLKSQTIFNFLMIQYYFEITQEYPSIHIIKNIENNNFLSQSDKKYIFLLFDDISYSGSQLEKISNHLHNSLNFIENKEIIFCFSRMFVDSLINIADYDVLGKFYCYKIIPNLPFIKIIDFNYQSFFYEIKYKLQNKLTIVSYDKPQWYYKNINLLSVLYDETKYILIKNFQIIKIYIPYEKTYPINTKLLFLEYKIPSFISINHFIISGLILDHEKFNSLDYTQKNIYIIDKYKIMNENKEKFQYLIDSKVILQYPYVFIGSEYSDEIEYIQLNFDAFGNISDKSKKITFYKSMPILYKIIIKMIRKLNKLEIVESPSSNYKIRKFSPSRQLSPFRQFSPYKKKNSPRQLSPFRQLSPYKEKNSPRQLSPLRQFSPYKENSPKKSLLTFGENSPKSKKSKMAYDISRYIDFDDTFSEYRQLNSESKFKDYKSFFD